MAENEMEVAQTPELDTSNEVAADANEGDHGGRRRRRQAASDALPPVNDPAVESRRRRGVLKANKVLPEEEGADKSRRKRKVKLESKQTPSDTNVNPPVEEGEPQKPANGNDILKGVDEHQAEEKCQQGDPPQASNEFWDLCMVIDVAAHVSTFGGEHTVQEKMAEAEREISGFLQLLREVGVQHTEYEVIDEHQGVCGPVMILCTASQSEFEEEAEIMTLSKPLILIPEAQGKFGKSATYGRICAPFSVARKTAFHESPYLRGDDVVPNDSMEESAYSHKYFSACERQYLLEHMIESKIRLALHEKILAPKTVIDFFPLHEDDGENKNYRDLSWLRQNWAIPLRTQRLLAPLKILSNPHIGMEEPIEEVRDYFGDQIAMYFAFLSFYTRWLSYPAIVGLAFQIWISVSGTDNWALVAYCVFITFWGCLMIKYWERKQSSYAYYWSTSDLANRPKVRREFFAAIDKLQGPSEENQIFSSNLSPLEARETRVLRRNKKTGQMEYKYPKCLRLQVYFLSFGFSMTLLGCVCIFFIYFYLINVIASYWDCQKGAIIGAIVHSSLIIITSTIYRKVAIIINDWEVHRTDIKYENSLILKIFLFEFCNNFLSMIWIAFFSLYFCQDIPAMQQTLTGISPENQCIDTSTIKTCGNETRKSLFNQLQIKLGTLFITRMIVGNISELLPHSSFFKRCMSLFDCKRGKRKEEEEAGANLEVRVDAPGNNEPLTKSRAWWRKKSLEEMNLGLYGDGGDACTVDDYLEIVIQFCFVVLFGVAFPLTAFLALISNIIESFIDSYKLCHLQRRPLAQRVSSIPTTWMHVLKATALASVITNIVVVFETASSVLGAFNLSVNSESKWIVAFVFEHIIVFVIIIIFGSIPGESKGITK